MHSIKRPVAALGAAAVFAISLTACGGGASGAPEDASQDDFCKAWTDLGKVDTSGKLTEEKFDKVMEKIDALGEVGTPKDVSEDERKGFEVFVDEFSDLSYDDVKDSEDDDELFKVSKEDDKNAEAFTDYAVKTCM